MDLHHHLTQELQNTTQVHDLSARMTRGVGDVHVDIVALHILFTGDVVHRLTLST